LEAPRRKGPHLVLRAYSLQLLEAVLSALSQFSHLLPSFAGDGESDLPVSCGENSELTINKLKIS